MYCIDLNMAPRMAPRTAPRMALPQPTRLRLGGTWGDRPALPGGRWLRALPLLGRFALALLLACGLTGCNSPMPAWPGRGQAPEAPSAPQARPQQPVGAPSRQAPIGPAPMSQAPAPAVAPTGQPARNWDDYRAVAARRIVAANPKGTYMGEVPEPLLAIPVLEVELNGNGSVRHIVVKRQPRQAKDTVQLAIAAVHRAAPFAPVTHLPRPWQFVEVFLFDDDRRFKPRSLD